MLMNCEDCGREVSKRAATCPHCGCPINVTIATPNGELPKEEPQKVEVTLISQIFNYHNV